MISDGGDSSIKKLGTINRRMFIFSIAKALYLLEYVADYFLQISENKSISPYR